MAYEKISKPILSGGLNLLAPGDQIDDTEAQELVNFSTDSFGALRSRRGHSLAFSVGGRIVSMTRALDARWVAAGGAVYKEGVGVIGGVSSTEVGLAGWQDFLWAMSEAAQRKSDGTHDYRWIPEAPQTAATIKTAAEVSTPVVSFGGGFTVDPAGDQNYSTGVLELVATGEKEYTATKPIALDLRTGFSLDDVFKIRLWAKRWKRIRKIVFEIDVNDGTFTKDYYTAEMLRKDINGGTKEEVTFYLRKRPQQVKVAVQDKKRYGWFDRIGQTADKDYRSCVKVRIKIEFARATTVRFQEWSLVGNADNTFEGDDFRAYYTYTTEAGHESNPSPESDPITVNRSGIDVSGMVPSTDPQVVGQNVYLSGGTLGRVYRVNGNTPVVGTSYQIRVTDDDLTNDGIILENDHDDPPQVNGLTGPYFGRLIAFGGSKFYWSHINKPYAFAGPDLLDEGDWSQVEEIVGNLLAATMRPGFVLFYGTGGVVMLQGDPGDLLGSAAHRTAIQGGIRSPNGVVQTPRGDFVNLSEGLYLVASGDAAQLLSKKIDPVFKDGFDPTKAAVGYRNDVVWISDGAVTYKLDLLTERWFRDSRVFSCFYSDGDALLGGTPGGQVLELEQGFADNGQAIPLAWKSKAYSATIDNECTFEDVTIFADTGGAPLNVVAYFNDGRDDSFTVALGTISSTAEERFVLQVNDAEGVRARNCAIGITGSAGGVECVITKVVLNYYFEARQAKSFDSDEKDFGTHKMKLVRQVYVDLQNDSPAQFILQTDQPGFAMATRDSSHSFGQETTRRGDIYVLASDVLAHNARFLLDGSDFRLYGMRALIQVIGTYLHGDKGEFWDSDVLDFGTERVKLYREIEVVYATEGTAELSMNTELAGGILTPVSLSPFLLTSTGGSEQTRKIRLRGNAKGRLARFRITPTKGLRLEAVRVELKIIGEPNATAWRWVGLPVEATPDGQWRDVFIAPDAVG